VGERSKEFFSAAELLEARAKIGGKLSEIIPGTIRGINKKGNRERWECRSRTGRGGGREYDITNFSNEIQTELSAFCGGAISALPAAAGDGNPIGSCEGSSPLPSHAQAAAGNSSSTFLALPNWQRGAAEAKAEILNRLRQFMAATNLGIENAAPKFVELYNQHQIEVSAETRADYSKLTVPSLKRWRRNGSAGIDKLADHYGNRTGSGLIDTQPDLRGFILRLIEKNPLFSVAQILEGASAEFHKTDIRIPSYGAVTRWIQKWKALNPSEFLRIANPDAWKSRYRVSLGDASAAITEPLQLVEIDGSPVDILCLDGRRYYMTVAIDVFTRLSVAVISKTANAEAALLTVRKFILKFGVPAAIKHDHGKEYESRRFQTGLHHLDIASIVVPPFSGDKKPHIERFVGTIMHGFAPWHGGFIGANVGERRGIESRKSFAARLGKGREKVLQVALTPDDLSRKLDAWIDGVYAKRGHRGLDGGSPVGKWNGWLEAGGAPRRVPDERALDVLLADCGEVMVRRDVGIQYANARFWHDGLIPFIGNKVRLCASEDMGEMHCFSTGQKPEFICIALNVARHGLRRREIAIIARTSQRKFVRERNLETSRLRKKFTTERVADAIVEIAGRNGEAIALPGQIELHDTPELRAAADALAPAAAASHDPEEIARGAEVLRRIDNAAGARTLPTDEELFARAMNLEQTPRTRWTAQDREFMARMEADPDYRGRRMVDMEFRRERGMKAARA